MQKKTNLLVRKMLTLVIVIVFFTTGFTSVFAQSLENKEETINTNQTIHICSLDDVATQDKRVSYSDETDNSWMTLELKTPSAYDPSSTDIEILSITYTEDITLQHRGAATIDLCIDVPPSLLQDMYKEMYGASGKAAVGEVFNIPEQSTYIQRENDVGITTSKSNFYHSLKEEYMYSFGVVVEPTSAFMIPKSNKNTFQLTAQADAYMSIKDSTAERCRMSFGPYALETSQYFFDYQLSLIGYAKLMMQSLPGQQVFKRTWTTTIHLPPNAELTNMQAVNGKHWFIDFSEGTYMTAVIEKTSDSTVVVREVLVVSESEQIIPQSLDNYKTFDLEFSFQHAVHKNYYDDGLARTGDRGGFTLETDPIELFDFSLGYTFQKEVFEATLTVTLLGDATVFISSDTSWILLQTTAIAELSVSFTLGVTGEKELFSWEGTSIIHIQAGPVPIQIWMFYGVTLGIEYGITLSTTVSATAGVSSSIKVGASYDWEWGTPPKIRWQKIWEADFTPFYDLPGLEDIRTEFNAWVTPYIEFPVSARLYGIFGPQIKPKIYLTASIGYAFTWDDPSTTLETYWSIRLGFSIWVGVVVGIPKVKTFEFGFDILDLTIKEWTNDKPGESGQSSFPKSLDTEPPVTTLVVNSPPVFIINDEYWCGQTLSFSFSAVDKGKVPVGVNRTRYYAGTNPNGNTYQDYVSGSVINVTTYTSEGYHAYYLKFFSVDNKTSSNTSYEAIKNQTINVDLRPPSSSLTLPETVYAYQTPITITATDRTYTPDFVGTGYFIMYRIGYDSQWTDWIKGEENSPVTFYVTREGDNTVEWFATDGVWNSETIKQQTISNVLLPSYADDFPYYTFSTIDSADLAFSYSSDPTWSTSTVYFDGPLKNSYQLLFCSIQSYHPSESHFVSLMMNDATVDEWITLHSHSINADDTNWHPVNVQIPSYFLTNNIQVYSSASSAHLNVTDGLLFYASESPYEPSNPAPADGAVGVAIDNVVLEWTGGDPDKRDNVWYSIYLGTSPTSLSWINTTGPFLWNITQLSWNYNGLLENEKTYYWYISAQDSFQTRTDGPLWRFTTQPPPSTVYVDDDYDASTPGWQHTHFDTIQDGINRVRDGGTVYVYDGTYLGSCTIYKQLSLQGNGSQTTILEGNRGYALLIQAHGVNVSGFNIKFGLLGGIGLFGEQCKISYNTINWTEIGVYVNNADNNISHNTINNVNTNGIVLAAYCQNSTVWNNTIYTVPNGEGIRVHQGTYNTIARNSIWNISGTGILLTKWSSHCVVDWNSVTTVLSGSHSAIKIEQGASYHTVTRNDLSGSYNGLGSGIFISGDYTTVLNNTARGGRYGICVWSDHNNISGNIVEGKTNSGIYVGSATAYNTISHNQGTNSGHSGIYLDSIGTNTTLSFNILGSPSTSQQYGIYLYQSHQVTLLNNTAKNNAKDGYYFDDSDFNTFIGNIGYANRGYNIYLNASQRNILHDNKLYGSNLGGIIMENICCYNVISNNWINGNLEGSAILVAGNSNNNTICNNTMRANLQGVSLQNSWRNKILNNTINGSCDPTQGFYPIGIYLGSCFMNNISYNTITTNHYGIYLTGSAGGNPYYYRPNTIYHNIFEANDDQWTTIDDYAIYIHESTITNPIIRNTIRATENSFGICIDSSSNQTVTDNIFEHAGISIQGDWLEHYWNTHHISNNTANGRPIRYYKNANNITIPPDTAQVLLASCDSFTISSLDLRTKTDIPIQLGFTTRTLIQQNAMNKTDSSYSNKYAISVTSSQWNTITQNIVSDNLLDGILLKAASDFNNLSHNSITQNGQAGIRLHESGSNIIFENSAITDNDGGIICWYGSQNQILNNHDISRNRNSSIELQNTINHLIYNNIITQHAIGVSLLSSFETNISRNTIVNDGDGIGIQLLHSSHNGIRNNSITGHQSGINLQEMSDSNTITANSITGNNWRGIDIQVPCCNGNLIFYNNFINPGSPPVHNAFDPCSNSWDNSQLGNHWHDYTGQDLNQDGIGDTPHVIPPGNNQDNFPLMFPIQLECGALAIPIDGDIVEDDRPTWTTGGFNNWFGQGNWFFEGGDALQSGPISDNQHSYVRTIVDGPGTLSFYWSVSSEPIQDTLTVSVDNTIQEQISGEVPWELLVLQIESGYHEITWTYAKNAHDSFGQDCGWIDNVVWTGYMTTPSNPWPSDGESMVSVTPTLSWTGGDPDVGDTVTYDIYFGTTRNPPRVSTIGPYPWDETLITWKPDTLMYGVNYYWKVVAYDNHRNSVESPVWSFQTKEEYSHAGLWHMDEGSGSVLIDETPYGNNGVISGASWTTGYIGSALYFDGDDFVTISHSSSLDVQVPFSVSAWIHAQGSDAYNCIVDKYHHAAGLGHGFTFYLNGGKLRFSIYSGANGNGDLFGTTDLRNKGWKHVRAEWDGEYMRVYVDGTVENQRTWAHPPAPTTNNLGIGRRLSSWGGNLYFRGIIDELHITRQDPPFVPSNPSPAHGQSDVAVSTLLTWVGGDPNYQDTVVYDVYLDYGDSTPDIRVASNLDTAAYDPAGSLLNNSAYYWYVIAKDNHGSYTVGPIWTFTTVQGYTNTAPNVPETPSPEHGAINQPITSILSWVCEDPDGDPLTYDVYLEANDPTPDEQVSSQQTSTSYDPGVLHYNTMYYWMIVAYDTHGAYTFSPVWWFTTEDEPVQTLLIQGNCFYQNMGPVDPVSVEIINLDTTQSWHAETTASYYSLSLHIGQDINATETLRFIAKDSDNSVNITDYVVTISDIQSGQITRDLFVDVHYRDLTSFPLHISTVHTGAAVMKMMLDYLRWNNSIDPDGPPSVYGEQELFDAYKDYFVIPELYYDDDSVVDEYEIAFGLNNEIRTTFPVPPEYPYGGTGYYGYFFSARGHDTALDALRSACIWLDYNISGHNDIRTIPVPQPGHPYHVPVAVPTGGNYDNWMVIRGIHTNRSYWDRSIPGYHQLITGPVSIYGFWLTHPYAGGLGGNTYVTVQYFMDNYFEAMTLGPNAGKYVVVTDPPENILSVETSNLCLHDISFAQPLARFTKTESALVQRSVNNEKTRILTNQFVIDAAYQVAENILRYSHLSALFVDSVAEEKPVYETQGCIVTFVNGLTLFKVSIGIEKGDLQQIQIMNQ